MSLTSRLGARPAAPGAANDAGTAIPFALAGIALLTLWRLLALYFDRTELWIDEAQYWLWGQSFSFGAYSKPPLIGWLIGLTTGLLGDSAFAVRVAAPVIHALTACVIIALGTRLGSRKAAALAGAVYITMPAATLGSLLISTDTPLLLAIALAVLLQHRLAARPSVRDAILLGLAVGLGFLSKQAMIYAVLGMCTAAVASKDWRITRRDAATAFVVALLAVSPNLWWIASHGFVTLRHLEESGAAKGVGLHLTGALRFLAEQFAVMGPIAFAAFLLSFRKPARALIGPLAIAAVILSLVTLQALTSRALANWAVGFTVTANIAAAVWLVHCPRLTMTSLGLGVLIALALPLLTIFGTGVTLRDGSLALARYLGREEVSLRAMDFAQRNGAGLIAAYDRGLLADLSWQARDSQIAIAAAPHAGSPRHHWDLVLPLDPALAGPVVLLQRGAPPACATGPVENWTAGPGFAEVRAFSLSLATPACLKASARD